MDLRLNVIVYGVGREAVEPLVLSGLRKHLGEVSQDSQSSFSLLGRRSG